ncbi:MAG: hypothetical protein JO115_15675 [Pseudonocardiales bacterium]|nr:hypothetical protein [Pseudonocardiales bacterium]
MSKSIPESAIHLGEPLSDIRRKIVDARPGDDPVIMRMVELASGWLDPQIDDARSRYLGRSAKPAAWAEVKDAYAHTMITYAQTWQASNSCRTPCTRHQELGQYHR